jgi:sterol desaturase/sphingolipid hydroxylase (fatty acid hydroxylase superfamily)
MQGILWLAVLVFWVYAPMVAAAIGWNLLEGTDPGFVWIAAPAAGLAVWSLLEYLIHRFVFHRLAPHWEHHAEPTDPRYIFAPLWLSLSSSAVLWTLFRLVTGSWQVGALVQAGVVAGYLAYEGVHLWIHSRQKGGPLLTALRKHHYYHHFADDTKCYGVVTPLWDKIFGSLPV